MHACVWLHIQPSSCMLCWLGWRVLLSDFTRHQNHYIQCSRGTCKSQSTEEVSNRYTHSGRLVQVERTARRGWWVVVPWNELQRLYLTVLSRSFVAALIPRPRWVNLGSYLGCLPVSVMKIIYANPIVLITWPHIVLEMKSTMEES